MTHDEAPAADVEWIKNAHSRPGFRVTIKDPGRYRDIVFEADVDEVTGWGMDGQPCEFEPYLECSIKWDSCSHLWFGEPKPGEKGRDGYLHLCGGSDIRSHGLLLLGLYALAFRRMDRDPLPGKGIPR